MRLALARLALPVLALARAIPFPADLPELAPVDAPTVARVHDVRAQAVFGTGAVEQAIMRDVAAPPFAEVVLGMVQRADDALSRAASVLERASKASAPYYQHCETEVLLIEAAALLRADTELLKHRAGLQAARERLGEGGRVRAFGRMDVDEVTIGHGLVGIAHIIGDMYDAIENNEETGALTRFYGEVAKSFHHFLEAVVVSLPDLADPVERALGIEGMLVRA
ncbi:hypothetical protein Q5752_003113 [Cryptotrichosporon argae]